MADREFIALNEAGPNLEAPQAGDRYIANRDVHLTQPLTTDSTIDGRDVAADGALAASALQPGANISLLVNDSGFEANVALASQAEAEAGVENTKTMTPLRVAQAIAILAVGLKNKLNASNAPVSTNDDSEGYSVGSFWIDITNDESYRCVDATTNLAVWVKTTLQTTDLATVALSGNSDDLIEGSTKLLLTVAERATLGALGNTAYVAKSGAYTVAVTDLTVDCTSGTFILTLGDAIATPYRIHHLKNSGTGVITVNTTAAQTIDGNASGSITLNQYDNLSVQSNGANWIIL